MNVTVHYPETAEGCAELKRRVAAVHAEVVIRYIQGLACSKEDKIKLLNEVKRSVRQE